MRDHKSIHGHEVIFLIHEAGRPLTRVTLDAEVRRLWGDQARFHTCSVFGMTLGELVNFLIARGKVVEDRGKLRVNLAEVCAHGDESHTQ